MALMSPKITNEGLTAGHSTSRFHPPGDVSADGVIVVSSPTAETHSWENLPGIHERGPEPWFCERI